MKYLYFFSEKLPLLIIIVALGTYFSPVYWHVSTWVPSLLLGIIIFFTGLSMNVEAFKEIGSKKRALLFVVLLKWTFTVFVSIVLGYIFFSSKPEMAAGLILSGTVPSATAATVYTFLALGNTSLVIAASLIDVILSPIITPLSMLGISSEHVSISLLGLLKSFVLIVVLPLAMGLVIQRISPQTKVYSRHITKIGSSFSLLLIVHTIVGSGKAVMYAEAKTLPWMALATFIQVVVPMGAAYFIAKKLKMKEQDARAALFQVGLCNTALAAILASKFIGELGTIAPILNMIFNLSIGSLIANRLSKIKVTTNNKPEKWPFIVPDQVTNEAE